MSNRHNENGTLDSSNGTSVLDAVSEAIAEQTADVISKLSTEQQAALESKFIALPDEVRSSIAAKYPAMTFVGMYIVRQMIKEANGRLASQKKPVWYAKLESGAARLKRTGTDMELRELCEEFDSKIAIDLLKKYKTAHDTTSKDAHIVQLCGIFGVNPATLA